MNIEITEKKNTIRKGIINSQKRQIEWYGYSPSLVCIIEPRCDYERIISTLKDLDLKNDKIYNDGGIYIQKIEGYKFVISKEVFPPFAVLVFPYLNNTLYIPEKESFLESAYIKRKAIAYKKNEKKDLFKKLKKTKEMSIIVNVNDYEEYLDGKLFYKVDDNYIKYPIVKEMFNKEIEIEVPKSANVYLEISETCKKYFYLNGGETVNG